MHNFFKEKNELRKVRDELDYSDSQVKKCLKEISQLELSLVMFLAGVSVAIFGGLLVNIIHEYWIKQERVVYYWWVIVVGLLFINILYLIWKWLYKLKSVRIGAEKILKNIDKSRKKNMELEERIKRLNKLDPKK